MGNLILYPFDSYSLPYIRHPKLLLNNKITGVVSPEGWGINGKDVSIYDGGSNTGFIVNNDFESAINYCDTILLAQSENKLDFEKFIYPKIEMAINKRKNIINTLALNSEVISDIQNKYTASNLLFTNYYYSQMESNYEDILIEHEYIFNITKPVIFVLGLSEEISKFEVQLTLREEFVEKGYRISQIGSRSCCEFLGFHSFPNFMFSKNISESNKVVLFNHFIKQIEEKENPDAIIIGIPGGIMPFNKSVTNRFGILAYEVCQAVTPDAAILCTYYQDDFTNLEKLSNRLKFRLGVEVSCIHISNKKLDFSEYWDDFRMHFITLDKKYIESNVDNCSVSNIPIFNVLNEIDRKRLSEFIIDTLNSYACTEII